MTIFSSLVKQFEGCGTNFEASMRGFVFSGPYIRWIYGKIAILPSGLYCSTGLCYPNLKFSLVFVDVIFKNQSNSYKIIYSTVKQSCLIIKIHM